MNNGKDQTKGIPSTHETTMPTETTASIQLNVGFFFFFLFTSFSYIQFRIKRLFCSPFCSHRLSFIEHALFFVAKHFSLHERQTDIIAARSCILGL
jgi:hypothetical protein